MKVALFDVHEFERPVFLSANQNHNHDLKFFKVRLTKETASIAKGYPCVCGFVNDQFDRECLTILKDGGTNLIALRSAGFNHVDLMAANDLNMTVVRVPEYSPHAVAEHAVGLMMALNRKIHRSYNRVRELNFSLDGLVGFDMHGKTVGIIGTGKIGSVVAKILTGFGCKVLGFDTHPNEKDDQSLRYVALQELFESSQIITLHVPLNKSTHHIINKNSLARMQRGVMIINTSRGGLIDTSSLIGALKSGHVECAGLDVYEEEQSVFFQDHSQDLLLDDVLARLLTFNNVIVTSHQGFLTQEALSNIAHTTLESISNFELNAPLKTIVKV